MTVQSSSATNRPVRPAPAEPATQSAAAPARTSAARSEEPAASSRASTQDSYNQACSSNRPSTRATSPESVASQGVAIKEKRRAAKASSTPKALQEVSVSKSASPNTPVRDNQTATSVIDVSENMDLSKLKLNLDIGHTYQGDLKVELTSPSGKTAVIQDRKGGGADDLKGAFDLSTAFAGEKSQGQWKLSVTDTAKQDEGTLRSWGLDLTGAVKEPPKPPAPAVITKTASPAMAIEDKKTITSSIDVPENADIDKLQVDLDINHTYRGDMVVKLTSPSGKTAVLSNKEGGSADDLKKSIDLSTVFAGEKTAGKWTLSVEDTASADTGKLNQWGLKITTKSSEQPPPPPANDDSDPMKHIAILSSDAMEGRDSPSSGLTAASAYVQSIAQKYGLQGPNTANTANPYQQAFDVFSFKGLRASHDHHGPDDEHHNAKNWGSTAFESGFYLSDKMPKDSLKLLNERYEQLAKENGVKPQPSLTGGLRSVEELRALAVADTKVQNTMAMLPGTGPHKDEVIVVMAHLDHVGVGRNGVFNGADDNASGSSVLLAAIPELVEAQKQGKLDRSILFLWTGGEEKGLLGSQYFADHPIPGLGLDKISGVVNMDMVGRWDDQRISVIDSNSDGKSNYFKDIAEAANTRMADPFDRINRDINAYRLRQDGAVFTRRGEDVLFVFEGLSNPKGGGDLIPEYHGTGDDMDKIIADNGGEKPRRVKDFMVDVLKSAVNRPE